MKSATTIKPNIIWYTDVPTRGQFDIRTSLLRYGFFLHAFVRQLKELDYFATSPGKYIYVIDLVKPQSVYESLVKHLAEKNGCPIVLLASEGEISDPPIYVKAGANACVIDAKALERIGYILYGALARFEEIKEFQSSVNELKNKLAERTIIERAKGLLCSMRALSEDDAYRVLQKLAMHKQKKLAEIAEEFINNPTYADSR